MGEPIKVQVIVSDEDLVNARMLQVNEAQFTAVMNIIGMLFDKLGYEFKISQWQSAILNAQHYEGKLIEKEVKQLSDNSN